jgi:hypothetical protein
MMFLLLYLRSEYCCGHLLVFLEIAYLSLKLQSPARIQVVFFLYLGLLDVDPRDPDEPNFGGARES